MRSDYLLIPIGIEFKWLNISSLKICIFIRSPIAVVVFYPPQRGWQWLKISSITEWFDRTTNILACDLFVCPSANISLVNDANTCITILAHYVSLAVAGLPSSSRPSICPDHSQHRFAWRKVLPRRETQMHFHTMWHKYMSWLAIIRNRRLE